MKGEGGVGTPGPEGDETAVLVTGGIQLLGGRAPHSSCPSIQCEYAPPDGGQEIPTHQTPAVATVANGSQRTALQRHRPKLSEECVPVVLHADPSGTLRDRARMQPDEDRGDKQNGAINQCPSCHERLSEEELWEPTAADH